MNTDRVWQLLEQGGLRRQEAGRSATGSAAEDGGWQPGRYDGFADPAGAEALGRALAERARSINPDVVLVWEAPQDAVLAFVVARELGTPVVRAYNMDGLVGHSAPLAAGSRVLIVADALRDVTAARAMAALAEQQGARIAGTAVLVATDRLDEVRPLGGEIVALVDDGLTGDVGRGA